MCIDSCFEPCKSHRVKLSKLFFQFLSNTAIIAALFVCFPPDLLCERSHLSNAFNAMTFEDLMDCLPTKPVEGHQGSTATTIIPPCDIGEDCCSMLVYH
jgi:hypothetical protein